MSVLVVDARVQNQIRGEHNAVDRGVTAPRDCRNETVSAKGLRIRRADVRTVYRELHQVWIDVQVVQAPTAMSTQVQ